MLNLNRERQLVDALIANGQIDAARTYCRSLPNPPSQLWLFQINKDYPVKKITLHPNADPNDTDYPLRTAPKSSTIIYDGELTPELRARYRHTVEYYEDYDEDFDAPFHTEDYYVSRFSLSLVLWSYFNSGRLMLTDIDPTVMPAIVWLLASMAITLILGIITAFVIGGVLVSTLVAALFIYTFAIANFEIILRQKQYSEQISLQVKGGPFVLYESINEFGPPIFFQSSDASDIVLTYPPSVASFIHAVTHAVTVSRPAKFKGISRIPIDYSDSITAKDTLRGVLVTLWATDHLQFRRQISQSRYFFGPELVRLMLVVQSGSAPDTSLLGIFERQLLDALQKWEYEHRVEHSSLNWSSTPTLDTLLKTSGRGRSSFLTPFILNSTRNTMLGRGIAKSVNDRDEWLSVYPDTREALATDATVIHAVIKDTRTFYPPIADEIDYTIARRFIL